MPNFRGNEDLGKLGQEYLNDLLCKFSPFCLQHSKTFDILHAFLRVTIAELSTLKQVRFFWPTLYILEKFSLYFTHLPRSAQWTDLHEILHGESSRGRSHLFQILCRSVQGFRICAGSNCAILPLLSRSPLTQGCATARL